MVTLMSDISQTIGRVRRAMPRNVDVMEVCDALDKLLLAHQTQAAPKLSRADIQRNYRLRKKGKA